MQNILIFAGTNDLPSDHPRKLPFQRKAKDGACLSKHPRIAIKPFCFQAPKLLELCGNASLWIAEILPRFCDPPIVNGKIVDGLSKIQRNVADMNGMFKAIASHVGPRFNILQLYDAFNDPIYFRKNGVLTDLHLNRIGKKISEIILALD